MPSPAVHTFAPGPDLDTHYGAETFDRESDVNTKHIWTEKLPHHSSNQRESERQAITLPARLTWKDQRGATRFATVVTRNVSEYGVYVECPSTVAIPLYRLVQFQLERDGGEPTTLPEALRQQGRILSAVYRVSPPQASGTPQGFALRLMVDPKRRAVEGITEKRATA
jgi:hypothetical protein